MTATTTKTRQLLAAIGLSLACLAAQAVETLTVRLIGTGGPELTRQREGMSTLISYGTNNYLFDVGRGALQNIYASRVHPNDVTRVFLTHLHNDHYEGLASLWMTPWFMYGRKTPIALWGPKGTAELVEGMRKMYAHDVELRANPLFKREYLDIRVTEIEPGKVYDADGVQVTAFAVEHKEGNPAFGYRIDAGGRTVLLSGDTTYVDELVKFGTGVDVLVSNVVALSDAQARAGTWKPVTDKLMLPEQAARIFSAARPRLAVYSHIVKKDLEGERGDKIIVARTHQAGYAGPLLMGRDRMTIVIGDTVKVLPPASLKGLQELDRPGLSLK